MGGGNAINHRGVLYHLFKRRGSWAFAVSAAPGVRVRASAGYVSSKAAAAAAKAHIDSELRHTMNTTNNPRSAA